MRNKLLAGSLSLLFWLAVAPGALGDFDQLIKQAHVALTKLDMGSARAMLSQACESEATSGTSARTAVCETETGVVEEAASNGDTAELHYRRALVVWNQLGPAYASHYVATLMNLGSLYRTQRRNAEAEDMLTQAFDRVRQPVPTAGQATGDRDLLLAVVTGRLGIFYSESGTPERGRSLLNDAISMLRKPGLSDPAELACDLNSLGILDLRAGSYKTGELNLREAVSAATDSLGESHPDTALYDADLALALHLEGQYARAQVLLNRARHIVETRLPPGSSRLGTILANLTAVEIAQGQFARAEADGEQSLVILARRYAPETLELAAGKVMLASVYLHERKIADAEKILPSAVALERQLAVDSRIPDKRALADGIRMLGELRGLQHNWHEAQTLYSEAIAIYESTLGPSHPSMAPVLLEYANVLKQCGAPKAEVKDIEARARAIRT